MYNTLSQARRLESQNLPWQIRLVKTDPSKNEDKYWEARSTSQRGIAAYSYGKRGTNGRGPTDKSTADVFDTASKKVAKGYVYEQDSGILPGIFARARTFSTTQDSDIIAVLDSAQNLIAHTTSEGARFLRAIIS